MILMVKIFFFQIEIYFMDYLVRISSNNRGQIEIDLNKQVDQMWKSIGKFSSNHLSVCSMQDFRMHRKKDK